MRFHFVKQADSMQCGIACMSMICKYFGKKLSRQFLESRCHPTKEGVSLKGIADLCESLHLDYTAGRLTLDNLVECPMPCILHWNQNHFVVLYKIDKDGRRFWIADPAKGKYRITTQTMKKRWLSHKTGNDEKGIAMFFCTTESFDKFTTEDTDNKISFLFLSRFIKQYQKSFFQIILGLILGCILQLIMPFLTQWIVDIGILHKDINLILLILLGELMIITGRTATDFIRRWLLLHISMRVNISFVSDFFIKLLKLPMSFFDTKLMGDLLQRIGDHSRVQNFLSNQVVNLVFSIFSFTIFGIVLLIFSPMIFSVFAVGSVVYGVWIGAFLSHRKVLDYEVFGEQAKIQNRTYQFISSIQEIKLQGCECRRRLEWEDAQADLFAVQMKVLKLQQTQEAGSIFINEIKNILITVFSATAVINGHITLGTMLAIQYIVGQLNSPIEHFMQFIYSLQDVNISLERINEIHERKNEESNENQAKDFRKGKTITIGNVDFKYDLHALKNTLTDISFDIQESKVTAIVGASGSGKTTLIKLMLGYYPVLAGTILIAGRNIKEYNLKWWRSQCGVVMQDGVIFSESIERNIAVDDSEIDIDRLERAGRIANIHDYVMSLPLKYNTMIGRDGMGLSKGQKQRILIARAVYKDPDFIFFDEATNALDAKNEKVIVENLHEFYKGRTVVIVAHRLSTVKNADRIVVLDGGKVVEVGDHTSLLKRKGSYYQLVKNQLELGN